MCLIKHHSMRTDRRGKYGSTHSLPQQRMKTNSKFHGLSAAPSKTRSLIAQSRRLRRSHSQFRHSGKDKKFFSHTENWTRVPTSFKAWRSLVPKLTELLRVFQVANVFNSNLLLVIKKTSVQAVNSDAHSTGRKFVHSLRETDYRPTDEHPRKSNSTILGC